MDEFCESSVLIFPDQVVCLEKWGKRLESRKAHNLKKINTSKINNTGFIDIVSGRKGLE